MGLHGRGPWLLLAGAIPQLHSDPVSLVPAPCHVLQESSIQFVGKGAVASTTSLPALCVHFTGPDEKPKKQTQTKQNKFQKYIRTFFPFFFFGGGCTEHTVTLTIRHGQLGEGDQGCGRWSLQARLLGHSSLASAHQIYPTN